MIELPSWAVPVTAMPAIIDYGGFLRPELGGPVQRVDRMGNRFRVALTFHPFENRDKGRIIVSRLVRAKTQGLRVEYPLDGIEQGMPGQPVVDGAGQGGTAIAVRGLTPRYTALEGYWLSIEDANGQHYLHNVTGTVIASGAGAATIPIEPMLRRPFADGCRVHLARPMIEGLVDGSEWAWSLSVDALVEVQITIEEAA